MAIERIEREHRELLGLIRECQDLALATRLQADPEAALNSLLLLQECMEAHIQTVDASLLRHVTAAEFRKEARSEFAIRTSGSDSRTESPMGVKEGR